MKKQRFFILLAVAFLVRLTWMLIFYRSVSSDDLQYALMGEAMRHGESFPLVAWGIGYGGTLTSSGVLAVLFTFLGANVWVVLAYGLLLSLLQVVVWWMIAEELKPNAGWWVGLLLAIPPPHMGIMMQQISYADSLLAGAFLCWLILKACRKQRLTKTESLFIGFIAGYIFYAHPIPMVFLAALLALWRCRVRLDGAALAAGAFLGVLPLLIANVLEKAITLRRIGARVLNANASQLSANASVFYLFEKLAHQIAAGISSQLRLIAEAFSSDLGLSGLGIIAACFMVFLVAKKKQPQRIRWLAWPVIIASFAGNILLGENARARFLMPAFASSSLLAGLNAAESASSMPIFYGLLAINGWQMKKRVKAADAGIPYAAAIEYIASRRLKYGYSNYWTSLPLTFLSQGRLQVSSTATDSAQFYDRTKQITSRVDQSPDVFYVFRTDDSQQAVFIRAFEALLNQQRLQCKQADLGVLRIYTDLSRPVRPKELNRFVLLMNDGQTQ